MKLNQVAEIKFTFPEKLKKPLKESAYWITASGLQSDNNIGVVKKEKMLMPSADLLLKSGDIVIKRINPQFVNYIEATIEDLYAGANLIIIRAKSEVCAEYLAFVLENNINNLCLQAIGSVTPSISKKDIVDFEIGRLPSFEKQKAIGELWRLQQQKKGLYNRLYELEKTLLQQKLKKNIQKEK